MFERDNYSEKKYGADRGEDEGSSNRRSFHRKKVCRFCADNKIVLDYKDVRLMQSFMLDFGTILPRRVTGTCAQHQRKLTVALKRARQLALVHYSESHNLIDSRF
ncbi:MAG: 30S ribosomal protein S18 [Bdellovibrionota bacterium]